MPQGMIWQIVLGSFGVAAAFLLVGGWVLIRFQRDRQQFKLMQVALERGITTLPGLVPGWVMSLRQGVLALVLGIGVGIGGYMVRNNASHIAEAPNDETTTRMATADLRRPPPPQGMGQQIDWDAPP